MQNKFNKITWAVAIAAAAFASQANAGGYQINEQSVSGQGYGHAGRSSNVNDASIVFGNPAGMSFLDRAQFTAGGTYLHVNTDIDNATATRNGVPVEGTADGDIVPGTLVPFAFYAHPVNERLAFGFGLYAPFGSKTDYESSFVGRSLGNYTEVTVMTAQPTVSYRFNDQWSVGAGITYNRVDGELRRAVPVEAQTPIPGVTIDAELDSRVEGDDEAWGYNLGVIYQPVPETTLGLTYRSKVSYTLEGDFRANATSDVDAGPLPVFSAGQEVRRSDARLDLTTPETINFSVTQQMTDRLKLMAGASWVRWSRFDEIRVTDSAGELITNEQQNYSNAWAFAVGGEYQLTPQLALRAGVTLDEGPSNDNYRSARIPSDDRRIFSLGLGWTPTENLTLDFAYSYLTERSTRVNQERNDTSEFGNPLPMGPDTLESSVDSTYSADYKNEAHGFGAQLTYRF